MRDRVSDEASIVGRTGGRPATRRSLAAELGTLGLRPGSTALVHSSLSALGWVVGGAEAVVLALEDAVGPEGTVMMPAYSESVPEPSEWHAPPVPEAWWDVIRAEWPPFDPDRSPALRLGAIAETFRAWRGTVRSFHPQHSFCARGANARKLLEGHALDRSMGEGSPLARLYDADGLVLLLGVDHGSNSSFHLSEYRATWPGKPSEERRPGARFLREGREESADILSLDLNSDDFRRIGTAFEQVPDAVRTAPVGQGIGRLMRQRALVDFGVRWMSEHRAATGPSRPGPSGLRASGG